MATPDKTERKVAASTRGTNSSLPAEPKTRSGTITHVVVGNNSRMLEGSFPGKGERTTLHTLPLRGVRNGTYNLSAASAADVSGKSSYTGAIVHRDDKHVFQTTGAGASLVKHDISRFDLRRVPELGDTRKIDYLMGRAKVESLERSQDVDR